MAGSWNCVLRDVPHSEAMVRALQELRRCEAVARARLGGPVTPTFSEGASGGLVVEWRLTNPPGAIVQWADPIGDIRKREAA